MWKRWLILAGVLISIILPPICQAQDGERITVLDDSVYVKFGDEIVFHLEAVSPAEITQVTLSYGPAGQEDAISVRPAGFQPGSRVLVDYVHDLKTQRIRAFSEIEFHWTISDARGHRLTTIPKMFNYEDNRFQWEPPLDADGLTVYWYGRPEDFGRTALYVAQQARDRIVADIGGDPQKPLRLYVYKSAPDLLGAVQIDRKEWLVGQAYPDTGTCLVVIPQDQTKAQEMERVIPHEISHLLVGTITPHLPYWLDEGLATDNEGISDPNAEPLLAEAVLRKQLLSFDQLCFGFPEDSREAALAYAQSRSLVVFIRERYGRAGLQRLINAYNDTNDCHAGVQQALGISLSSLAAQWESSLPQRRGLISLLEANGAWVALWLGSFIIMLLLVQSIPWPFGRRDKRVEKRS